MRIEGKGSERTTAITTRKSPANPGETFPVRAVQARRGEARPSFCVFEFRRGGQALLGRSAENRLALLGRVEIHVGNGDELGADAEEAADRKHGIGHLLVGGQ